MEIEQADKAKLEQILNGREKQISLLQKDLLKSKLVQNTLKDEKVNLEKVLLDRERAIADLDKEKKEFEANHSLISLEASQYKREAEIYDAFLTANLGKSDYYVKTIKQLDAELRAKLDVISSLDKQNSLLNNENTSFKDLESFFQRKENIYKTTLDQLYEDTKNNYSVLQERITRLEHELEVTGTENKRLKENENTLIDKISGLNKSLEETSNEKRNESRSLEQALDLSVAKNKGYQLEQEKLRAEVSKQSSEYETIKKNQLQFLEEKQHSINALTKEVQELNLKLIEKDAMLNRVKEENERVKTRDNLLNQGLEDFESQKERLQMNSKEELLQELKNFFQLVKLEREEKLKATAQLQDVRRDLAEKIPILLDKQAQYHRAAEENEQSKIRIEKLLEELTKVYKEKVSFENELKRIKKEAAEENFDATFLSTQISKLLVQNHKLKLGLLEGIGNLSVQEFLAEDMQPGDSVFYHDIEDLQKKHQLLVKRVKELKERKDARMPRSLLSKRPLPIEEEAEDLEEDEENIMEGAGRRGAKDVIVKKVRLDKEHYYKVSQEATDAFVKGLNEENFELRKKLREVEQEKNTLTQQIAILNVEMKKYDFQAKSQAIVSESTLRKTEENEAHVQKLLDEREALKKKLTEKDKAINESASKVERIKKENMNLQHKLTILEKETKNRKEFEERLNQAIENSSRSTTMEEEDSAAALRKLREDNIVLKAKVENQSAVVKNMESKETNLQRLLNQATQQFQSYSEKLNHIFFPTETKEVYHSSTEEVTALRAQLHELQEVVAFYQENSDHLTQEYKEMFRRFEDIADIITTKFASLSGKYAEQENQVKDQIQSLVAEYKEKVGTLTSRVETYVETGRQIEEEVYEDDEWVHVSEHQQLEEKLKKQEENTQTYKNMVDEYRDQLLQEREANLKSSSTQSQESEQIKAYLNEINNLTNEKVKLENQISNYRKEVQEQAQQLVILQNAFDKDIANLGQENRTLRSDLEKLTEELGKATSESVTQAGILGLEQRNNLLNYLRTKNAELALERDQLKAKFFDMRKNINTLKSEKMKQIHELENELISVKASKELETVPQTKFVKSLIEQKNILLKENENKEKLIKKQEQQIQVFESFGADSIEQEGSPGKTGEEANKDFNPEEVLRLFERAQAQLEVLQKIDLKDQPTQPY